MTSVAPAPVTSNAPTKSSQARSKPSPARHKAPDSATAAGSSSAAVSATPMDDDALLQSICQKSSSALMQPTITLTLYIPTSSVGAVIGRRGQNIALIQKQASQVATTHHPVRVSVIGGENSNSNPSSSTNPADSSSLPYTYSELDFSDPNWTPVVIRADPKAAFTAAAKLEETLVSSFGGVSSSSSTGTTTSTNSASISAASLMDQVVLDVPINRQKHAAIVGKRGVTLANLSADTNVRIMVPNKDRRHDVVQLEGDLPQVKVCLERLLQIASKASAGPTTSASAGANAGGTPSATTRTGTTGGPSTTTAASDQPSHSQTIVVDQLPSQTRLRGLSRKTDTVIKKKRADGRSEEQKSWELTVSGHSIEQVQAAVALLQKAAEQPKLASSTGTAAPGDSSTPSNAQPASSRRGKPRGRGGGGNNNKGSSSSTHNKRTGCGGNGSAPTAKGDDAGPASSSSLST